MSSRLGPQSCTDAPIQPRQTPAFGEFTLVLKGALHVEHTGSTLRVGASQAVIAQAGEWVRYSTPDSVHWDAVD